MSKISALSEMEKLWIPRRFSGRSMPEESFVSQRADGRLVVTLANTDMENGLEWKLPDGYAVVEAESVLLQAESFLPRSTFVRKALENAQAVSLPPFGMALIVLAK